MQYACSWGQIWTKERWNSFYQWYEKNKDKDFSNYTEIPQSVRNWGENSWLKFHVIYTTLANKYFVYPQVGLTSDFTDPGTHNTISDPAYQCNLYTNNDENIEFKFAKLNKAHNVYDVFFENIYLNRYLDCQEEVIANFYGEKTDKFINKQNKHLLLSTKIYNYKVLKSFSLQMYPYEMNIINNIEGNDVFLYDMSVIQKNKEKHENIKLLKYTYRLGLLAPRSIVSLITYFWKYIKGRIIGKIKREWKIIKK